MSGRGLTRVSVWLLAGLSALSSAIAHAAEPAVPPGLSMELGERRIGQGALHDPELILDGVHHPSQIDVRPDRFLFGTDEVAPKDQQKYLKVYDMYAPLLARLKPEVRDKLLKGNYERLFDAARLKVRAWERGHVR